MTPFQFFTIRRETRAEGEVKGHLLIDFIGRNFVNKDIRVIMQIFSNKM